MFRGEKRTSSLIFPSRYDILSRWCYHARLVKLADTKDLGSFAVRHAGSSPAPRTTFSRSGNDLFSLFRPSARGPAPRTTFSRSKTGLFPLPPACTPKRAAPPPTRRIRKKHEKKAVSSLIIVQKGCIVFGNKTHRVRIGSGTRKHGPAFIRAGFELAPGRSIYHERIDRSA